MALIDLKSDLSFYGKGNPGPYKVITDRKNTNYKGADNIPYVEPLGYESQGTSVISLLPRYANDSFLVDDVSFSDRGLASRKAQLGNGSKFPVGPEGQVHTFDIIRASFTNSNRYGDIYTPLSKAGLANTYTANSPIDDMYNKFNLRDDATPNSYIKQPLNLRGSAELSIKDKGAEGQNRCNQSGE